MQPKIKYYFSTLIFVGALLISPLRIQAQAFIDRLQGRKPLQTQTQTIYKDTVGAIISGIRKVTPDTILVGSEFLVELEIFKTNNFNSFVLDEVLPDGFMAEPINNGGAVTHFKAQKLTFKFSSPPKGKISYKVRMTGTQSGNFEITGLFSTSGNSMREIMIVESIPNQRDKALSNSVPSHEYKISNTPFYITKGIKLKPVYGSLDK